MFASDGSVVGDHWFFLASVRGNAVARVFEGNFRSDMYERY